MSPLYCAVIECVPAVKALLENVAVMPPARVTAGPKGVSPSRNVTAPLGVGLPEAVRLAVKVTFCPKVEGVDGCSPVCSASR